MFASFHYLTLALLISYFPSPVHGDDCGDDGGFSVSPPVVAYLLITILVMLSGLFSGLTLGLLGLDLNGLEIVIGGDNKELAQLATTIKPVRENGNLLLCTLLLGNVAVNALLSIILADYAGGIVGFVSSTVIIVIFGEIIPQAACSRYALHVGARTVPLVKIIMVLLFPITKPLSYLLDKILGDELGTIFSEGELIKMMQIHVSENKELDQAATVFENTLRYKDMEVGEVMTPMEDCFMVHCEETLSFKIMREIFKTGFSRIPIYGSTKDEIVGVLFVKDLIFVDPEENFPIKKFIKIIPRLPMMINIHDTLAVVLDEFRKGRGHMAIVHDVDPSDETRDPQRVVAGIITLEDIVEEILGQEIVDETDMFIDVDNHVPVDRAEFDYGRLAQLGLSQETEEKLSPEEVKAVVAHLCQNVVQFQSTDIDQEAVMKLIQDTKVVQMDRVTPEGNAEPYNDDVLYRRNQPNTRLTLVLGGKLGVIVGKDGFRSEAGPWTVLGSDALWQEEGTYVPDFTAHVVTADVRYIQISRTDFLLKVLQRGAGERTDSRERLNRTTSSSAMKRKRRQRRSMLANNLSAPATQTDDDEGEESDTRDVRLNSFGSETTEFLNPGNPDSEHSAIEMHVQNPTALIKSNGSNNTDNSKYDDLSHQL